MAADGVAVANRRRKIPHGMSRMRLVIGGTAMTVLVGVVPPAGAAYTFAHAVAGPSSLPFLINSRGPADVWPEAQKDQPAGLEHDSREIPEPVSGKPPNRSRCRCAKK